jgi:uncharacterized protein RhaS with RHS repeats
MKLKTALAPIVAILSVAFVANDASAYYAAHMGRWLTRDPIQYDSGLNLYQYTGGRPTIATDPTGLIPPHATQPPCEEKPCEGCEIKLRCGPVKRGGITLGVHCGVVVNDTEYGIGGAPSGEFPDEYANPDQPDATPKGSSDNPACCDKSCDDVQACIENYRATTDPPPYYPWDGPNSNTYAHELLKACGCDNADAPWNAWNYDWEPEDDSLGPK